MSVKWRKGAVVVALKDTALSNRGDKGLVVGIDDAGLPIVIFSAGHIRTLRPADKKSYTITNVAERFTEYTPANYFALKSDYLSGVFDDVFMPFPAFR